MCMQHCYTSNISIVITLHHIIIEQLIEGCLQYEIRTHILIKINRIFYPRFYHSGKKKHFCNEFLVFVVRTYFRAVAVELRNTQYLKLNFKIK